MENSPPAGYSGGHGYALLSPRRVYKLLLLLRRYWYWHWYWQALPGALLAHVLAQMPQHRRRI